MSKRAPRLQEGPNCEFGGPRRATQRSKTHRGPLWAWRERNTPAQLLLWIGGALGILSPVVHPWYVLWPLCAAMLTRTWAWGVLASTVLLSYLVLQGYDPSRSSWTPLSWIPRIEYPPIFIPLLLQARSRKRSLASDPQPDVSPSQSQMEPDPSTHWKP